MLRAGGRFLLAAAVVAVITLFLATGLAQTAGEDPRNNSEAYFDAVNGAKCFAHHGAEGFRPMDMGLKERYSQLPIGEVVELRLGINNPWLHTVQDVTVTVNTSLAPNVKVITEDSVENTALTTAPTLTSGAIHKDKFSVQGGATDVYVGAYVDGEPFGRGLGLGTDQGELDLTVISGAGKRLQLQDRQYAETLHLSGDDLVKAGAGDYQVEVKWESQVDSEMPIKLVMMVNYTQSQTEFIFRMGDYRVSPEDSGEAIIIPIMLESADEAVLDIRVEANSFWPHNPTDNAPRNDGLYYRWVTMTVRGGDSAIQMESAFGSQPVGPAVDLYRLFTRILGFVAALLIPIAMLTGGIFGKSSRRWLNKATGGAKKRVLWHSAMSWMILAVASFHFILAILEAQFVWTKGLFWGGVGWVLLISLGFTGYYQVRMIKRWNYKVWRHTHLWSAVAVLGFSLVHMTLDGSDLAVIRDALPAWHERLIWP